MSKWHKICTVDYWVYVRATVICFIDFIMNFWYMFIISPCYLNKLRNALKEII
jgi:hypothetical protein